MTSQGLCEARKAGKHDDILLKPPDEARVRDNVVADARSIEQGPHLVGMSLNLLRNFFSHEGALRIPPQQHLVLALIPHERQGIELTIERTLLVDATG